MPTVSIDLKELSGITPGVDNLKNAVVWFYPYRPYGSPLVTTDKLVVTTTLGVASTFLPQTPALNAVWVEIRGVRLPSDARKFLVAIPSGNCNLFDLPHLDPDTLDPATPLSPAWIDAMAAEVARAEAAEQANANNLTAHLNDAADAHDASAISFIPGGTIEATDVQAAIFEVAAEAGSGNVPNTRTVNGHPLSADVTVTKSDVGLGSVDNTSDANKPVSTAQQTALNLKATTTALTTETTRATTAEALLAPKSSPTFTGTVSGITKSMVGLGNVDNITDAAKPISSAAQTALDAKADLVGGVIPTAQIPAVALTVGQVVANRAAMLALTNVQTGDIVVISGTSDKGTYMLDGTSDPTVFAHWILLGAPTDVVSSVNGQTGTVVLSKTDVGLGNVDNTADASKPVSTLQAAADTAATAAAQSTSAQRASNLSDLANAATARTNLGLGTAATQAATAFQTADSDLTTIAGLTATTDNMIQSVGSAWASRTPAQVKTALALSNLDNTSDANKPVSTAQNLAIGPRYRVWVTGSYYGCEGPYTPGTISNGDGIFSVIPFWVHVTNAITSIGAEVTTLSTGSLRLGIYGSNANDQPSGAPLLDTGTPPALAATSIGGKETPVTGLTLTPGLYWLGVGAQGGAPTLRSIGSNSQPPVAGTALTTGGANGLNCYYMTAVTGALPTWSGMTAAGQGHSVRVKAG